GTGYHRRWWALLRWRSSRKGWTDIFPLPEKFDGSRDQLPAFLAQLYMQLRLEDFPSDQVKVAFLIGLLTGPAAKWATPYLLQPSPLLANLDGFMQAMRETWGESSAEHEKCGYGPK
uniref:DUF4939 domain-containing protein n=1 Tax=Salvator merianae TaxID=96440 RepID=A0A8D0B7Y4_SALMN